MEQDIEEPKICKAYVPLYRIPVNLEKIAQKVLMDFFEKVKLKSWSVCKRATLYYKISRKLGSIRFLNQICPKQMNDNI